MIFKFLFYPFIATSSIFLLAIIHFFTQKLNALKFNFHQNTKESPRILDPTKCKHAMRHLNDNENSQLNAFDFSSSFTFFDDIQKQRLLETEQPHFRIFKLNTFRLALLLGLKILNVLYTLP